MSDTNNQPIPPPVPGTQPGAYVPRPTNVLAIVSLVFGMSAWVLLPFFGAIVAVVCGHLARGEIQRSQGAQDGDGLAIGGLIMGYLQLGFLALILLLVLFVFAGIGLAAHHSGL